MGKEEFADNINQDNNKIHSKVHSYNGLILGDYPFLFIMLMLGIFLGTFILIGGIIYGIIMMSNNSEIGGYIIVGSISFSISLFIFINLCFLLIKITDNTTEIK
ncbi:hypothetical protein ACFL1H_07525, partial [Nanoarchaeota archaeon]